MDGVTLPENLEVLTLGECDWDKTPIAVIHGFQRYFLADFNGFHGMTMG
jgi:hypothetical protein